MELRKLISWRLERLSERDRAIINEWADHQDNIQQSLTNIVLHTIKRFGKDVDIMDFEIQNILYAESLAENQVNQVNDLISSYVEKIPNSVPNDLPLPPVMTTVVSDEEPKGLQADVIVQQENTSVFTQSSNLVGSSPLKNNEDDLKITNNVPTPTPTPKSKEDNIQLTGFYTCTSCGNTLKKESIL